MCENFKSLTMFHLIYDQLLSIRDELFETFRKRDKGVMELEEVQLTANSLHRSKFLSSCSPFFLIALECLIMLKFISYLTHKSTLHMPCELMWLTFSFLFCLDYLHMISLKIHSLGIVFNLHLSFLMEVEDERMPRNA